MRGCATKVAGVLWAVSLALLVLSGMLTSLVALIRRFRHSQGRERLQLKWFTYAAAVLALLVVATFNVRSGVLLGVFQAVVIGPGLAIAAGVAMLRHRLYDIDVVINRTLVYGLLTAALAGFYRRRYDAARTLEGFSARLREQVDLDALGGEPRSVVSETMQPAHVSLWLRGAEARR